MEGGSTGGAFSAQRPDRLTDAHTLYAIPHRDSLLFVDTHSVIPQRHLMPAYMRASNLVSKRDAHTRYQYRIRCLKCK